MTTATINSAGPWRARAGGSLSGRIRAPGDKSISHRAVLMGATASGRTRIRGLLEGEDVLRTAAAMRALGAAVERNRGPAGPVWGIEGGAWRAPDRPLYFGNSGTGVRLAMGAVAGAGVSARFEGDASLRARPMGRVLEPLRAMGLKAQSRDGRLPVAIDAGGPLRAIDYALPTPSAQVKSALLLAGLGAAGMTIVREPVLCRDHTERMLAAFGANLEIADKDGVRTIAVEGGQRLTAAEINVPGDPSSAAFPVVAALITPGSDVIVENVLINSLRIGLYKTLLEMGADLAFENERVENGEPVADIRARHSALEGVTVPAERAASMIDEYPALSVAAAFADGETLMQGIGELRVKESDRLTACEAGLEAAGVAVESGPDWLRVIGDGAPAKGGARIETQFDHRIAMSFLVMGLAAREPVEIDDGAMIATSFPGFLPLMKQLRADLGMN
ncbi:MAG: 3-phosphoshikimate 1-carboxyvinyltransferase [Parvularculaceae bacterium]